VGLLRHGGHLLADGHVRDVLAGSLRTEPVADPIERNRGGFWTWFRAAF